MKKKLLGLVLAATMVFGLAACGSNGGSTASSAASSAASTAASSAAAKKYTVGICNYVDDASLNQIVDNIKAQLEKVGKEKNVEFVIKYDNCNADSNVLAQIVSNFQADKVDLMVAVATPVAMAMQSATEGKETPVVFAAVSDPISTKLVDSMDKPGKNITGTSDALDTTAILKLMAAYNSGLKKVGLLYDLGQDSSTTAIAEAKKFLAEKNIEVVEKTGTNVNEVKQAAESLVAAGVDAVFTPTDNTIMEAELSIYEIFKAAKIPHYTGADSFALNGAFLGYGVDYANLGVETANMVAEVLIDGKKPAELAVKTFDNGTATVNKEICEALGTTFEAVEKIFAPLCTKVQSIETAESFS